MKKLGFVLLLAVTGMTGWAHFALAGVPPIPSVDPRPPDACQAIVTKVVALIEESTGKKLTVTKYGSQAETRDYTLLFEGLAEEYRLVLDNDSASKCQILSLKYGNPDEE